MLSTTSGYWSDLANGLWQAIVLLSTGDAETWSVIRQSLLISGSAVALSLLVGLPLGTWLANARFRGRQLLLILFNLGFGLPPVLVGLVLSLLLLRHGPLGCLNLRFTAGGVILAQFILCSPIVIALAVAAIQQLPPRLHMQIIALGASRLQKQWLLWREARLPLQSAAMAAFGSIVSEVGASLIIGGNLPGSTRVLTTAIVQANNMGDYDRALAYGLILLLFVLLIVGTLTWLQQREAKA